MATKRKTKTKSNATGTVSVVFGSRLSQVKRISKSNGYSVAAFVRKVVLDVVQRADEA